MSKRQVIEYPIASEQVVAIWSCIESTRLPTCREQTPDNDNNKDRLQPTHLLIDQSHTHTHKTTQVRQYSKYLRPLNRPNNDPYAQKTKTTRHNMHTCKPSQAEATSQPSSAISYTCIHVSLHTRRRGRRGGSFGDQPHART